MGLTIEQRLASLTDEVGPSADTQTAAAEVLVATAYAGRDRDVWGGDRALTFWDRFPDLVRAACYRGPTVAHWWDGITRVLGVRPPTASADRTALAKAIGHPDQYGVLDALRLQPETICLRVRLAWQYTRTDPPPKAAAGSFSDANAAALAEGVLL